MIEMTLEVRIEKSKSPPRGICQPDFKGRMEQQFLL